MASEIIERLQAVATIEEIDRELETLNEQKRTIENEADALLELRRVITVAKEGKPARKARVVRAASPVTAKTRADLVPSSAKGPTDKPHSEEDCKVWRDEYRTRRACAGLPETRTGDGGGDQSGPDRDLRNGVQPPEELQRHHEDR